MAQPLKFFLKNLFNKETNWKLQLLENWTTIMGDLHDKVSLESIKYDTVYVSVINSCWLQELYILSPMLLQRINETLDQAPVKKIRFKKRAEQNRAIPKSHINRPGEVDRVPVTINSQEKRALHTIDDALLRKALYTFLVRCYWERGREKNNNSTHTSSVSTQRSKRS